MSEVNKVSDMNNPADYDLGAEEILQEEIAIQHLMEGYIMPNNFNTDLLEPQEISAVEQQRILNQTMHICRTDRMGQAARARPEAGAVACRAANCGFLAWRR